MSTADLLKQAQFVVDSTGNKIAVMLDYTAWEKLLTYLEDLEDVKEFQQLRQVAVDIVPWEKAKEELRAGGLDV